MVEHQPFALSCEGRGAESEAAQCQRRRARMGMGRNACLAQILLQADFNGHMSHLALLASKLIDPRIDRLVAL
jgi:hypothetical protein